MNAKSLPTVNELVNTLKKSFIPTILIEGNDDVYVYRYLKSRLNTSLVSLQVCGGRPSLMSIYERRNEFVGKNIIFVADRDSYRFEEIPEAQSGIIFTSGYCIENDIFAGSNILTLLDEEDACEHNVLREIIGKWFSFEVDRFKARVGSGRPLRVADHINLICPNGTNRLCPTYAAKIGYEAPSEKAVNEVFSEYELNVRGKQLFQMLSRFLSKPGRFSKFTEKNLIEIALKSGGGNVFLDALVDKIQCKIDKQAQRK